MFVQLIFLMQLCYAVIIVLVFLFHKQVEMEVEYKGIVGVSLSEVSINTRTLNTSCLAGVRLTHSLIILVMSSYHTAIHTSEAKIPLKLKYIVYGCFCISFNIHAYS